MSATRWGKGWGRGKESTSDVIWSAVCGVEISRGLSRCLPHGGGGGGGGLNTSDVMRNAVQFHFGGIFLWTSSCKTGGKPRHFSLTAFGEEVFFWVGNVERPIGERFDEEKLRNARVDFPPRYRKTQSRKGELASRNNGLADGSGFVKRSRAFRGEPCWQAREGKSACSAQMSRQTCKRKPLGKRKALEFRARTSRIQYLHNRRWAINPENPGFDNKDWAQEWKAAFHRFEETLRLARSRGL